MGPWEGAVYDERVESRAGLRGQGVGCRGWGSKFQYPGVGEVVEFGVQSLRCGLKVKGFGVADQGLELDLVLGSKVKRSGVRA